MKDNKDIRFIAVDFADPKVQALMNDKGNAFTELDRNYFGRSVDGLTTSFKGMNNYVYLTGKLAHTPQTIEQNGHSFIYTSLIVEDGYYNAKHEFQKHEETVPLRFSAKQGKILLAKAGDEVQVTGKIIRFISKDAQNAQQATSYYYLDVVNCALVLSISQYQHNLTYLLGKLQEDPQLMVNHSQQDTKFYSANLVIPDGYVDNNGNYCKHKEVIPVRFYKQFDEIKTAKQGDTVMITGNIRSWGRLDAKKDQMKATEYFYINAKGFSVMFGSSIRKQVKAKFYPKVVNNQKKDDNSSDSLAKLLGKLSPDMQKSILAALNQENNNGNENTTSSENANDQSAVPFENAPSQAGANVPPEEPDGVDLNNIDDSDIRSAMSDVMNGNQD